MPSYFQMGLKLHQTRDTRALCFSLRSQANEQTQTVTQMHGKIVKVLFARNVPAHQIE